MRVVIVGGGKIGGYLTHQLREAGEPVIVIERSESHATELAEETDALTVAGDGTDLALLQQLEIRPTDMFVALTGIDEDNLVACQLARSAFGVKRVLARLNDPRNHPTFTALQIPVVSVTDLLSELISRELDVKARIRATILDRGGLELFECEIPEGMPLRTVQSLRLPPSTVIVTVTRSDAMFVPASNTELAPGDRVLVIGTSEKEADIRRVLTETVAEVEQ